jgi:hypothetical protein
MRPFLFSGGFSISFSENAAKLCGRIQIQPRELDQQVLKKFAQTGRIRRILTNQLAQETAPSSKMNFLLSAQSLGWPTVSWQRDTGATMALNAEFTSP